MAPAPSGSHTFHDPAASGHAQQINGNIHGSIQQAGTINHYHGSPLVDFRSRCLAALGAADPEAEMGRIISAKHSPLPQCYSWIEDDPSLKQWSTNAQCRLLRIGGDPGKGKTMLMIALVQKLKAVKEESATTYFFCQSTDNRLNSAKSVVQGLIWCLVASNPELGDEFDNSFRTRGELPFCSPNADFAELSKLLSKLLSHPKATQINVLVDALDECDVDKVELLGFIAEDSKQSTSKAKWLVSSRNHSDIEQKLNPRDETRRTLSLELNSDHVSQAVDAFIEMQVEELESAKGSFSIEVKTELERELKRKAEATFLWVALVFKELEKVPARKILEHIKRFPATLEALYGRMLEQIKDQGREDTGLCRSVMRAAVLAQRPLSLAELGVVAGLPDREFSRQEHISQLVRSCGSFVDIRDDICYFVHQSAKDFFLNPKGGKGIFGEGLRAEHEHIFSRSLAAMSEVLIRDNICSLTDPGSPPPDSQTITVSPLGPIRYSCTFWMMHLEHSLEAAASNRNVQANGVIAYVALRCLDYLRTKIGGLRTRALPPKDVTVSQIHDFLVGQFRIGVGGLRTRVLPLKDATAAQIHDFFAEKCLRWVEAMANLGQLSVAIATLQSLEQLCAGMADTNLYDSVKDIKRVVMQCGVGLSEAPLQIYSSALAFAPSRSTTRQRFEGRCAAWLARPPPRVALQWDAALQTLEGHSEAVNAVTFSPDGRQLASCSSDKTVRLWDANTGAALHTLEGHSKTVSAVTFSPDGRRLASCSEDKTVRLWDADIGAALHMLEGHSDVVNAVTFSPDGRRLASCSLDKTVWLWDADIGAALHTLKGHRKWVSAVTFSPNGQRLASCSEDKTVRLWDADTGAALHTLEGHSDMISAVTFSHDGRQLASCSSDKTVRLWDADTGAALYTLKGHSDTISAVTFSPDGQRLASCSSDKTVRLWDADIGAALHTLKGHRKWVSAVTFSPDGQRLASGSEDKTVRLWDAGTGAALHTLEGHSDVVYEVTFSPDGQRLASCSWDKTVRLWDADTGAALHTLEGHSDVVYEVTFSPDGQRLASCSWDKTVQLWDADTGAALHTLEGHSDVVNAVTFSPDGQQLASCSWDKTVQLWDANTGAALHTLEGHRKWVRAVTFSPDGRRLASYSYDHTIRLWDADTGAALHTLEGHSAWVRAVTFSPDGQRLASCSHDHTIRLWDADTGAALHTLEDHSAWVRAVTFSPDGRRLASCSGDKTVRLWDADTGRTLDERHDDGRRLSSYFDDRHAVAGISSTDRSAYPWFTALSVSRDRDWILYTDRKLLWIPVQYRSDVIAFHNGAVAVGCMSGVVYRVRVDLRSLPP